jgi:hypothetical protein
MYPPRNGWGSIPATIDCRCPGCRLDGAPFDKLRTGFDGVYPESFDKLRTGSAERTQDRLRAIQEADVSQIPLRFIWATSLLT